MGILVDERSPGIQLSHEPAHRDTADSNNRKASVNGVRKFSGASLLLLLALVLPGMKAAEAATYYWVTWNSYSFDGTTYTLTGTITTGGATTVTVTYTNTQGVAGYQLSGGSGGTTNYYSGGTDGAAGTSPYTSATVENRPDNVTIVRLSNAGAQTLTFSQSIANLALAFVSLNGNAFSFDRNFDVLSFGDSSDGGNACGYWGCGTATEASGSGSYPYVVSGTGEPHGTLHFPGSFSSLTWTSGNENWHGFTVGIAGTAAEVPSDTTPPTVTISPANGTTNVALGANITVTFNEEVRNLNDTPLTNTNVDSLITLKTSNASGADIPFDATIDSANRVITINPTTDFSLDQIVYVAIGATVEDTYGNAIAATSATMTTGTSLPATSTFDDPRTKQDVVGNIEAWSNIAQRWAKSNLDSVTYRFDWLRRNEDARKKSHHGANIRAADPVVDSLIRATSGKAGTLVLADATDLAQKYFSGQEQAMSDAKTRLTDVALFRLVQATEAAFVDANPGAREDARFENWSWWTQGEVMFGKVKGTDNASLQRANDFHAFVGLDRPLYNDGRVGFAVGLGESGTKVGSSGSEVESNHYGFSVYAAYKLRSSQTLEGALGYGRMLMDIVRIDSGQTLSGERDANQIFGSIALHGKPLRYGNFSTSPYGRLEAARTKLESFSEAGGTMALNFDEQTLDTTMVFIGVDVLYVTNMGNGQFRPFGKLEYGANTSHESEVDMHYVSDTTDYRFTLDKRATSLWKTALGFDYQTRNGTSVAFVYSRTQAINSGHLNSLKLQVDIPLQSGKRAAESGAPAR